jgi:hypothetical protein
MRYEIRRSSDAVGNLGNNLVNLTLISNYNRSVNIGEERGQRLFEQKTPDCNDRGDHLNTKALFPIYRGINK